MQLGLQSICYEQQDVRWRDPWRSLAFCNPNNIGCYVATANSAPEFSWNTDQLYPDLGRSGYSPSETKIADQAAEPDVKSVDRPRLPERVIERLRIEVPNSRFVQTVVGMQWAINALPMDLWQALKLGDTMSGPEGTQVPSAPPYPSITEAFSILMANKTASMESWPWVPPPPPPPPTPPPCPGGSLQECMKLCPKTEAYKSTSRASRSVWTCVQSYMMRCVKKKSKYTVLRRAKDNKNKRISYRRYSGHRNQDL
jgi:hypothetical protein